MDTRLLQRRRFIKMPWLAAYSETTYLWRTLVPEFTLTKVKTFIGNEG